MYCACWPIDPFIAPILPMTLFIIGGGGALTGEDPKSTPIRSLSSYELVLAPRPTAGADWKSASKVGSSINVSLSFPSIFKRSSSEFFLRFGEALTFSVTSEKPDGGEDATSTPKLSLLLLEALAGLNRDTLSDTWPWYVGTGAEKSTASSQTNVFLKVDLKRKWYSPGNGNLSTTSFIANRFKPIWTANTFGCSKSSPSSGMT